MSGSDAPAVEYLELDEGMRLAWSAAGEGKPALLHLAGWVSHLEMDWTEPGIGAFHRYIAQRRRLIRYDRPGVGMADRRAPDFAFERQLEFIIKVLDAAQEQQVVVVGKSLSGPLAIMFAAKHPERVSHLVLCDTAARLVASDEFPEGADPKLAKAVEQLVRAEWGMGSRAIGELMLPHASHEVLAWYSSYQRSAANPDVAGEIIANTVNIDTTPLLRQVMAPTLVIHHRDDRMLRLASGERLASEIPNARLLVMDGSSVLPYFDDAEVILAAIESFINPRAAILTQRELDVLRMVDQGASNGEIAAALDITEATAARHLANVFIKLDVGTRGAAVAAARHLGLFEPT